MTNWFTADTHIGHNNIMKYCGRTIFMTDQDKAAYTSAKTEEELQHVEISNESTENMNNGIITRWNSKVMKGDNVFFLGDFCFTGLGGTDSVEYYTSKLNGNIIYIQGNHDKHNRINSIIQHMVVRIGNLKMLLVHRPPFGEEGQIPGDIIMAINYVDLVLCGHVHDKWKHRFYGAGKVPVINVGVDVWDFKPIDINDILSYKSKMKSMKEGGENNNE